MKNSWLTLLAMTAAALLIPRPADGHHGLAAFDQKTVVTLKGTVTDFHFVNPHAVVEFEVKDDKGRVEEWKGELSSAGALAARGWTAASLQAGDPLTISGYPAKNGAASLWATKLLLANGQELKLGGGN
jgi:hypothetical protein